MPCWRWPYPPAIGLPMSIAARYAKRSRSRSKRRAIFARICARSFGVMRGPGPLSNASRAARTAAPTSSADASAIVVSGSPVNGLVTVNALPPDPARHFPPTSIGRGPGWIHCASFFTMTSPSRSHRTLVERGRAAQGWWCLIWIALGDVRCRLDAEARAGRRPQRAVDDRARRDRLAAAERRHQVVDARAHLEPAERRRAGSGVQVRGEPDGRRRGVRREPHAPCARERGDAAQLRDAAAHRGVRLPHVREAVLGEL